MSPEIVVECPSEDGREVRMSDNHELTRRRRRLELLKSARERGYLTLWEATAASTNSPVDLDDVGELLSEAGLRLDDSNGETTNWVREPRTGDDQPDEDAVDDVEDDVDRLPTRIFEPTEYSPETPAAIYLRDISRVPLLTAEEEVELAQAIERGEAAREKLVRAEELVSEQRQLLEDDLREGAAARKRLTESNLRLVVS